MAKLKIEKNIETCCFTGHRPSKMPWKYNEDDPRCIEMKNRLYDTVDSVYVSGIRHFICGMAVGCDMYFCEAVIQLRSEKPGITLEAALPCEVQARMWNRDIRNRYYRLVSECDYQTLLQSEYSSGCMMRRNRYMVDNSVILIAAYNGSQGGTMHTIKYALRKGLTVLELPF